MHLLLSLTPPAAHRLLSYWDSLDSLDSLVRMDPGAAATTDANTAQEGSQATAIRGDEDNHDIRNDMTQQVQDSSSKETDGDGLGEFFRDIFAPCGDSIPQVIALLYAIQMIVYYVSL